MPLGQLHEERPALLEATDAMSWSPYRSPPGREHFDAPGVERRGHLLRSGRRWLAEDPRHERFRGPSCWVDRALVEAVRALGREFKALFWRERGPRRSGPEATDSPVVGGASSPVPTPAVAMTTRVPRGRAGARGGCRRRAGSHDGRHRLELVVLAGASRHTRALEGPVLDATIIAAPSSTKNATGTRDPAMHQTQKGRQWYFGMKGHVGVDSRSKLIHSVEVTPANVHDSQALPWLLHGEERRVWGDSAYAGQGAVLSVCAPHARDFIHRRATTPELRATNRWKSRVRARVEHPIGVIKRVFGFTKVCYRGLAKNRHRLVIASALANLFMVRRRLLRLPEA